MQIPVLETERLVLREFRSEDFEPMADFYADPISSFYGGPCGREDAWRKFAIYPGHWSLRDYGPWALEEKATGEFVGLSGLWFPEGWPEPEITWALLPEFQGRGFATEAARRSLQAAYEHFGWTTAISLIDDRNKASMAVALRIGATDECEADVFGSPGRIFRHARLEDLDH